MTHRATTLAQDLSEVVSQRNIERAWKNSIRNGLRRQLISDLHDYLDFHRNLSGIAARVSSDVVRGHYRTSAPEFVTLEKRDGITRRLAVPDPADALVLQCIVDTIEPHIGEAQPTNRAFYARSHMPPSEASVDSTFAYPWMQLWPEFQERIWEFTSTHEFVVVTDIANFFDTIPLHTLRNTLASIAKISENVLNLLFFALEALTWRPYFMPHSGVGLPQIDFDAPRLLANAYLFKLDQELEHTSGSFVRWMDDIDAGVNSREEGKKLLQSIQSVLNSQGLQLNSNKSKILFAKEAVEHFCIRHNRALTIIQNSIENGAKTPKSIAQLGRSLRASYSKFRSSKLTGNWDKVQKRYLNLFGKLKDPRAIRDLPTLLSEFPSTRGAIFRYLIDLGYSEPRFRIVENFLASGNCVCAGSLFEAVKCLISWDMPLKDRIVGRILTLAAIVAEKHDETLSFPFGAALLLMAKYAPREALLNYIDENHRIWERSAWASRQVAAVSPLLPDSSRQNILAALQKNGLLQGLQVWESLASLQQMTSFDRQLRPYLFDTKAKDGAVIFSKVVLAFAMLSGCLSTSEKTELRAHFIATWKDKWYRALIAKAG